MVYAAKQNEIRSALLDSGGMSFVSDEVVSKCAALSSTYQVTPHQLADCWAAFSLNKNLAELDTHNFESFRLQVVKTYEGKYVSASPGAVITRPIKRAANDNVVANVTPPSKKNNSDSTNETSNNQSRRISLSPDAKSSSLSMTKQPPKYRDRRDPGKVAFAFNPMNLQHLSTGKKRDNPKCTVSHSDFDTNVTARYRHMFTTMDERALALDKHLEDLSDAIVDRFHLGQSVDCRNETGGDVVPIEAVGVSRQDKICCLGRICNAAHEGRINATSVVLEGSRKVSGGARIEVDLSSLQSTSSAYSVFPGQIVAIEGHNTTGRKLVAERIIEGAAYPPMATAATDLLRFHHHSSFQDGEPIRIMAAAGPFTTSNNLEYEPWEDLMSAVVDSKPDVVILTGPFVDMRHQAVSTGETTVPFEDGTETFVPYDTLFATKISALIEEYFDLHPERYTQFILIPNLDDANAEMVFPQPPFPINSGTTLQMNGSQGIEYGTLGLHRIRTKSDRNFKVVHCMSNPCTIKINEIVVGVVSQDILYDISADETNANLEPGSRLSRICQHMLQQRSYYPLFPGSSVTNLNLKQMKQWQIPCSLDLLIIPSKLTSFAKPVLEDTVVINMGHLCRDTTGGMYALIEIHPMKRDILEGSPDDVFPHKIAERTIVEIKRI